MLDQGIQLGSALGAGDLGKVGLLVNCHIVYRDEFRTADEIYD